MSEVPLYWVDVAMDWLWEFLTQPDIEQWSRSNGSNVVGLVLA